MESPEAARNAWVMGATSRRLLEAPSHFKAVLDPNRPVCHAIWLLGYYAQAYSARPLELEDFQFLFDMNRLNEEMVTKIVNANKRRTSMPTTRTAEELAKLRAEFTDTYGDQPVEGFEAAFTAHLAELDAAAPPTAAAPSPKSGNKKGGKATGAKKGGKAKAADAKPKKAAAAPKAKAFRPTSADRQAFNAAAAKVAGKDVKTPRLLPKDGKATYTDFLQGKVLKLDANGNGSTVLNVVSAKDTKTVLGTVTVEVKGGKVKATGAKA